jgi:hypothetical protein
MKRCIALALFVLAGVGFPSAFALSFTSWVEGEGGWDDGAGATIVRESQRRQELECQQEAIYRCIDTKTEITRELLAGRVKLNEAVRYFHEAEVYRDEQLDKQPPPLDSTREKALLKCVLNWARAVGSDRRADRERVLRAAEVEYRTRSEGRSASEPNAG